MPAGRPERPIVYQGCIAERIAANSRLAVDFAAAICEEGEKRELITQTILVKVLPDNRDRVLRILQNIWESGCAESYIPEGDMPTFKLLVDEWKDFISVTITDEKKKGQTKVLFEATASKHVVSKFRSR